MGLLRYRGETVRVCGKNSFPLLFSNILVRKIRTIEELQGHKVLLP